MITFIELEPGDAVLVKLIDRTEEIGIVMESEETDTLFLNAKDGPTPLPLQDIECVVPLNPPRAYKIASPRISGATIANAINAHYGRPASGSNSSGSSGSSSGKPGGALLTPASEPKPPVLSNPYPCQQPVTGGGGKYHPIGKAKDGGCCCDCGGIGMQY